MKTLFTIIWIVYWALFTGMFWFIVEDKFAFWILEGMLTVVYIVLWFIIITKKETKK